MSEPTAYAPFAHRNESEATGDERADRIRAVRSSLMNVSAAGTVEAWTDERATCEPSARRR